MTDGERFWPKVHKTSGCWIWMAAKGTNGYGRFHRGTRNHWEPAHRVSWILTCGSIPKGMFVLHHCDVPLCVNPAHLFLGTHRDNMADAVTKGRMSTPAKGAAARRLWNTDARIRRIRMANLRTPKPRAVMCKYGHPRDHRDHCHICKLVRQRERRAVAAAELGLAR